MARIRSIKPEYWSDATIATFDYFTRLFYIALWNFADDEGRGRALCKELAGFAFPLDEDLPNSEVERALQALCSAGRILLYDSSGIRHFQIVKWNEHQNINRPTASRLPAPSVSAHVPLTEPSSEKIDRNQESILLGDSSFRSESVRSEDGADAPAASGDSPPETTKRAVFVKPTNTEVAVFFKANGSTGAEARKYWDFYQSNGWKVGKNPMRDWEAAARNWIARIANGSRDGPPNGTPLESLVQQTAEQVGVFRANIEARRQQP